MQNPKQEDNKTADTDTLDSLPRIKTVSYQEFFPGNFGVGGVKNFLGKKNVSYEEIFRQISSPRISSGNFGSNSPSRENFEAQNFLETRGNFTRKFWDHLII